MSLLSTTDQVTQTINTYLPATVSAVMAVEAAAHQLPGETKLQAVVDGVMAATQAATAVPIPSVAAVAGLANLVVSLLNAFGVFNHGAKPSAPAAPQAPAPAPTA